METLSKDYNADFSEDSEWVVNTPGETQKSFLMYVQETGHFRASGHYFTVHNGISSFLIMYTLSGEGIYEVRNRTYRLRKGDLVFIDCMEHHKHKTSPDSQGPWDILWVQFNGVSARGYYNQFRTGCLDVIRAGSHPVIRNKLEELIRINKIKLAGTEFMNSKILIELLTEILFTAEAVVSPDQSIPDYIRNAINYIELHYSDSLSLDFLADRFCVSKFHFAKEFKKFTGYPPIDFIINTRINNAKKYLQFSDYSVQVISEAVGFNTACHFINTFSRKTGITPHKFRMQFRS